MANEVHLVMGDKARVYKRENSSCWQCSTFLAGRNWRVSTKQESLKLAKEFAEDWFLTLTGRYKGGQVMTGKTFKQAAEQFLREYGVLTDGQRHPVYVAGHERRVRKYLVPFFGNMLAKEVSSASLQEYRIHRRETTMKATGKPPARSTMHQEMVVIRQVLKTALRYKWIDYLPDMTEPYVTNGKISHRAWFSPEEYKKLYTATRKRAKIPLNPRYTWEGQQLHDLVLFVANTGLRPDEVARLEYRDVAIVADAGSGETILEIEVRGKRGVGFCKSMTGAVAPFQRLKARNKPAPTDRLFPSTHHALFNTILEEEGLKFDRDNQRRTLYSLRHTYICFRLMEGADIYQVAKNCRTSVEMIEKYYASHIKTMIDASAINVRRPKPLKAKVEEAREGETA